MSTNPLDDVDRGILHLLQQDARNLTPVEMARQLPVSEGTVRNRIEKMEQQGVIQGYVPTINYEAAGFPIKVVFRCTVPITQRAELVDQALDLPHTVNVREYMTGRSNVHVLTIATSMDDITSTGLRLEELGANIEDEVLLRREAVQPFDHLGIDIVQSQ